MRLYLSSFRIGDHPDRLLGLLDRPGPAVVIANAMDAAPADVRREAVQLELTALGELGIEAEELDLRDHFDNDGRLDVVLAGCALVWLRGGNVFMLRHALARSGADTILIDLLRRNTLVYAGYSAGPCVLAPSLRGLELVDDAEAVRTTYDESAVWEGLGVLDYAFVPHFDSPGHPETEDIARVARRYQVEGVAHRTLRDGQAIVVDGDSTTIL